MELIPPLPLYFCPFHAAWFCVRLLTFHSSLVLVGFVWPGFPSEQFLQSSLWIPRSRSRAYGYQLTNAMQHSPSSETNSFLASQIHRILWDPKFHHRLHRASHLPWISDQPTARHSIVDPFYYYPPIFAYVLQVGSSGLATRFCTSPLPDT
jgi:hypothetical protein